MTRIETDNLGPIDALPLQGHRTGDSRGVRDSSARRRRRRGRGFFVGLRRNDGRIYWGCLRAQAADVDRMIDEFNAELAG